VVNKVYKTTKRIDDKAQQFSHAVVDIITSDVGTSALTSNRDHTAMDDLVRVASGDRILDCPPVDRIIGYVDEGTSCGLRRHVAIAGLRVLRIADEMERTGSPPSPDVLRSMVGMLNTKIPSKLQGTGHGHPTTPVLPQILATLSRMLCNGSTDDDDDVQVVPPPKSKPVQTIIDLTAPGEKRKRRGDDLPRSNRANISTHPSYRKKRPPMLDTRHGEELTWKLTPRGVALPAGIGEHDVICMQRTYQAQFVDAVNALKMEYRNKITDTMFSV
jgi:hypothetical protein